MVIYESAYITISVLEKYNFLKAEWKTESEDMSQDYFRKINKMYIKIVREKKLTGVYIDTRDFLYTIVPEEQEWVAENIIPELIGLGIKRIAFTVSKDMISQLSVEQTMEENTDIPLQVFYFSEPAEAERWLAK